MWPVGFISVGIWEWEPARRRGDEGCSAVLGYQYPWFCCHKELGVWIQKNLSKHKSTLPSAVFLLFLARGSLHLPCTSNTVLNLQWEVWEAYKNSLPFYLVVFLFCFLVLVYFPKLMGCRFFARERAVLNTWADMKWVTGTTALLIQSCKIILKLLWLMLPLKSSNRDVQSAWISVQLFWAALN